MATEVATLSDVQEVRDELDKTNDVLCLLAHAIIPILAKVLEDAGYSDAYIQDVCKRITGEEK